MNYMYMYVDDYHGLARGVQPTLDSWTRERMDKGPKFRGKSYICVLSRWG